MVDRIRAQFSCCLRQNRTRRLLVVSFVWVGYLALYFATFDSVDRVFAALAVVPIALTGLLFGVYSGLIAGVVFVPFTWVVLIGSGVDPDEVVTIGAAVGGLALALVGGIVGGIQQGRHRSRMLANRLVEVEERFSSLLDGVPVGIYQISADAEIIDANPAFASMFGYANPAELVGVDVSTFLPEDSTNSSGFGAAGFPDGRELKLRDANGVTVWVRDHAHAVLDEDGSTLYFEGILQNITDQRRSDEALIASDRRFREAFDHAPIAMAIIGTDGVLAEVNEAFGNLLGYTTEELAGRAWASLTHPDDVETNARQAREIMSGAVDVQRVEKRYVHRDGHSVWALMNATAVRDAEGEVSHLIGQVVDLSDRKRAEQALEELLRSKDEFVASVSHELRTPLSVVHGLTTELRDSLASFSEEEVQELVELVVDQSAEVVFIVEDLLVAARSDAGTLSVRPQPLVVREEIDRVLDSLGRPFGGTLEWSDDGAGAFADPTRLRQIVRNLATNAKRYGGDRVRIEIEGSAVHTAVRFIDDGDGIPREDRRSIFDAYVSAHQVGKRPGSVGLGLTVSRRLARLMGGDLSYRYENNSSCFELVVPATEHVLASAIPEPVSSPKI